MGNEDYKERIRQANDIIDVVGSRVDLEEKARGYWARCPFHTIEGGKPEKTPSFHVDPQRQTFHCFACEEGGDVFSFIEKYEMVGFRESIAMLAERAGISISDSPQERQRENLVAVNEQACQFFQHKLNSQEGKEAQDYLARRKITPETIAKWRIGYAPDTWTATANYLSKYFHEETLIEAGIVKQTESGRTYDTFRGRVTFPIFNRSGRRILGFGGRVLEKDVEPKYLNSPETEIFHKKEVLYGFNLASKAARKARQLIIVEGYTDAIHAHQRGIENVAATIGVSLSDETVGFLNKRKDLELILCFDGDEAGKRAAERAAIKTITRPATKVWLLPQGQDPGSIMEAGQDFRNSVEINIPSFEFLVRHYKEGQLPSTLQGKLALLEKMQPVLLNIEGSRRGICIETLAQQTGISVNSVIDFIYEKNEKNQRRTDDPEYSRHALEVYALKQILANPNEETFDYLQRAGLREEDFHSSDTRAAFGYITSMQDKEPLFHSVMPLGVSHLYYLIDQIVAYGNERGLITNKDLIGKLFDKPRKRKKPSLHEIDRSLLAMRWRGLGEDMSLVFRSGRKSLKELLTIIKSAEKITREE